jgi:ribonuclease Z
MHNCRFAAAVAIVVLGLAHPLVAQTTDPPANTIQVVLLGTMGGPTFSPQRFGISTLVMAGRERLLFDVGRASTMGMSRAGIAQSSITRVFLTHLHSDHIADLPVLYLEPWASQNRLARLRVWGPKGTRSMMEHLQKAFAFDIHVRRDIDERHSAEGIRVTATDIAPGVIYQDNGVTVTAFLVDHAPVAPAYGYRIDYGGHSVVISGDTKPSANVEKMAAGVDLLVHEVGSWKHSPDLEGPLDEIPPNGQLTRRLMRTIADHHTDPEEAGSLFARITPKLVVFSHDQAAPNVLPLVRQHYDGPVEIGEDSMVITIGERITVRRPPAP